MFPAGAALLLAAHLPAPLRAQGKMIESVEAFYSPSAAVFAADGRTLYVANAARGDYGMLAGKGAISKATVSGEGEITVDDPRLVEGLNAPLGITLLRRATSLFPEGALVVTVGGRWTVDSDGSSAGDARERGTGLAIFSAEDGSEIGRVYLGEGSPIVQVIGRAILDPTAVVADPAGNLYIADVAGFKSTALAGEGANPGVIKLTSAAVDALAKNQPPPPNSAWFAAVPNIPTGLAYPAKEDALYWVTGDGVGDLGGAVFRLPRGDFTGVASLETVAKGLRSLVGLALTPNGTVLAGRNEGDIVYVRDRGRGRPIKFRPEQSFLSAGQLAVTTLDDGRIFVVVPELSGAGHGPWRHRLEAFTLPADF